jgi:hypothetical protein
VKKPNYKDEFSYEKMDSLFKAKPRDSSIKFIQASEQIFSSKPHTLDNSQKDPSKKWLTQFAFPLAAALAIICGTTLLFKDSPPSSFNKIPDAMSTSAFLQLLELENEILAASSFVEEIDMEIFESINLLTESNYEI